MRYRMVCTLLLLTAGLTLMPTGPLLADAAAQAAASCADRLGRIERRLADADLADRKETYIRQIIEGARTLAKLGDDERFIGLADQLDGLLRSLSSASPAVPTPPGA
jgi:hypothetical protein